MSGCAASQQSTAALVSTLSMQTTPTRDLSRNLTGRPPAARAGATAQNDRAKTPVVSSQHFMDLLLLGTGDGEPRERCDDTPARPWLGPALEYHRGARARSE